MNCTHLIKSGSRKGQLCGKKCNSSHAMYCSKHALTITTSVATTNPQLAYLDTIDLLQLKLVNLETTIENQAVITKRFRYLETLPTASTEYQKNLNWLRHALNFPYNKTIKIPVAMKAGGLNKDVSDYVTSVYARLDSYIYGLTEVKEELMSYVCKRISNPDSTDHILALQGGNGVGKSRLAHGLASALDLPIKTINLGSVNDVSYFTGHGFTYVDSEPGRIVQILNETQCKNCIIYFDELDKIHQSDKKGQAIYAFLTHLLDPTQNKKFQDVYLSGLELDLSRVFFVFSMNDENLVDGTVRDRLKVIKIKDPSREDKINIAEKFLIPELCQNINYTVDIDRDIIDRIVQLDAKTIGGRGGLRGIRRVLEDIIAKLNVARMLDEKTQGKLSFYHTSIDDMIDKIISRHNVEDNASFMHMYH